MTKKGKSDRDRVNDLAREIADEMLFAGYTMKLKFADKEDDDEDTVFASCKPDWPYRSFTITVYPPFFDEPEESWALILRHEFVHVILHPLADLIAASRTGLVVTHKQQVDAVEFAADWLASILS